MTNTKIFNQYHLYSFLVICIVATYFISYGSFELFQKSNHGEAYASAAQHLMKFEIGVDRAAIHSEKFVRNGEVHMYFGALPAFLRMPLISLFPKTYGLWNCWARLIAYIITLFFLTRLTFFTLNKNDQLTLIQKQVLAWLAIIGFGLGSPLYHLTTHKSIFYEAVIWGLCLSTISTYLLLTYLYDEKKQSLTRLGLISFVIGLTVLARVSYAIPLFLILIYLCVDWFIKKNLTLKKLTLLILPFMMCFSFQLYSNYKRFGNVLSFTNYKYYGRWLDIKKYNEDLYEEKSSMKTIEFRRIPYNFKTYFLYQKNLFVKKFPYFNIIGSDIAKRTKNYEESSPVFPFTFIYSWLLLITLAAGINIFLSKDEEAKTHRVFFLCFLVQSISILMYKALNHRYETEFMPLCIFSFYYYIRQLGQDSTWTKKLDLPLKAAIIVYSIIATTCFALHWRAYNYYGATTKVQRQQTRDFINKVNKGISLKTTKLDNASKCL